MLAIDARVDSVIKIIDEPRHEAGCDLFLIYLKDEENQIEVKKARIHEHGD